MSHTRTTAELQNTFADKIEKIRRDLKTALQETNGSSMRREYAIAIAVVLRSLFCRDKSGTPLIESSKIEKHILFPHNAGPYAVNLMPYFSNVGMQINNNQGYMHFDGLPTKPNCFLSSYDWLYEIVVDFMLPDYPPLPRNDIIKIVADKQGAHCDQNIDKNVFLIEKTNVTSVQIVYADKTLDIDCSNLFTEMIISIASDLIYAYDGFYNVKIKTLNLADYKLYKYDFSDNIGGKYKFKYMVILKTAKINAYNPNNHFNCDITEQVLHNYLVTHKTIHGNSKGRSVIIDTIGILNIET